MVSSTFSYLHHHKHARTWTRSTVITGTILAKQIDVSSHRSAVEILFIGQQKHTLEKTNVATLCSFQVRQPNLSRASNHTSIDTVKAMRKYRKMAVPSLQARLIDSKLASTDQSTKSISSSVSNTSESGPGTGIEPPMIDSGLAAVSRHTLSCSVHLRP
jgi:hypothetical protein